MDPTLEAKTVPAHVGKKELTNKKVAMHDDLLAAALVLAGGIILVLGLAVGAYLGAGLSTESGSAVSVNGGIIALHTGSGIRQIEEKLELVLGSGLSVNENAVQVVAGNGLGVSEDTNALEVNFGDGLVVDQGELTLDPLPPFTLMGNNGASADTPGHVGPFGAHSLLVTGANSAIAGLPPGSAEAFLQVSPSGIPVWAPGLLPVPTNVSWIFGIGTGMFYSGIGGGSSMIATRGVIDAINKRVYVSINFLFVTVQDATSAFLSLSNVTNVLPSGYAFTAASESGLTCVATAMLTNRVTQAISVSISCVPQRYDRLEFNIQASSNVPTGWSLAGSVTGVLLYA
jgi:hypothetical protein